MGNKLKVCCCVLLMLTLSICGLTSCNKQNQISEIQLKEEQIQLALGDWKVIYYTVSPQENDDVTVIWGSSNSDVAIVSPSAYNFGTIQAKGLGTCTITIEANGKTDSVCVTVLYNHEITITQLKNDSFSISSKLPVGTILDTKLSNENFTQSKQVVLEESTNSKSAILISFENPNEELNGKYTLTIALADFNLQPETVKDILGENGEWLTGKNIVETTLGKSIFIEQIYELPYKTELEKIQDTSYKDLTKNQMLTIIHWIENRYEYYDEQAGYYTGDKYTKTIFNEAAERYNKTYSQISSIWDKSYELKYGN